MGSLIEMTTLARLVIERSWRLQWILAQKVVAVAWLLKAGLQAAIALQAFLFSVLLCSFSRWHKLPWRSRNGNTAACHRISGASHDNAHMTSPLVAWLATQPLFWLLRSLLALVCSATSWS